MKKINDQTKTKQPVWKIVLGIVLVLAIYVVGQMITGEIITLMVAGSHLSSTLAVAVLLITIVAMFFVCKFMGIELGEKSKFKWWYILLVLACPVINLAKTPLLTMLFGGDGTTANGDALVQMTTALPVLYMFVSSAIFAPIAEEVIFRGIGMHVIFKKYLLVGLFVSSIVFTAMHLPTNLFSFFNYFTMGLMYGGVFLITKDLRWSILAHVVNNAIFMSVILLGPAII